MHRHGAQTATTVASRSAGVHCCTAHADCEREAGATLCVRARKQMKTKALHNTGCIGYNSTCAHRTPHGGPTKRTTCSAHAPGLRAAGTRSKPNVKPLVLCSARLGAAGSKARLGTARLGVRTPRRNNDKREQPETILDGRNASFPIAGVNVSLS